MKKCTAALLCSALGILLFALLFPYNHDMYIGWVHTVICAVLNGASCLLFAVMFFQTLTGRSLRDDFGIYLWFLLLLGIGHGIFAFMNWGSWVCLVLSVPALALLIRDRRKKT